jgi:tryptophan synthase alpha chain
MGGDPDIKTSGRIIDAVVRGGADIIEVGIPFSDPMADGRSIQAADIRSLSSGTTPMKVLDLIRGAKSRNPNVPVIAMTYYNILYSRGLDNFLEYAKDCEVDGIIVPDLPLDEVDEYAQLAKERGLDAILLAAPTTSPARMRAIVKHTSGFLYLVSLLGVTGARIDIQKSTLDLVQFAKRYTKGNVPLGVGFGISTPDHVRAVLDAGADAIIVGSAIVDKIASYEKDSPEKTIAVVEDYLRSLKAATKRA